MAASRRSSSRSRPVKDEPKTSPSKSSSKSPKQTKADWSSGAGFLPGRETVGPLALMFATPLFSIVLWYVSSVLNGGRFYFIGTVVWSYFWSATFTSSVAVADSRAGDATEIHR